MMVRELGMRDGFAGGSAVRYMDTRPQQPEIGEEHWNVWVECVSNGVHELIVFICFWNHARRDFILFV